MESSIHETSNRSIEIPKLEKTIEEKDEEIKQLKSFETQLNNFRVEYDTMKKENEETSTKTKELQIRKSRTSKTGKEISR